MTINNAAKPYLFGFILVCKVKKIIQICDLPQIWPLTEKPQKLNILHISWCSEAGIAPHWEHAGGFRFLIFQMHENPCKYWLFRVLPFSKKHRQNVLTTDLTTYGNWPKNRIFFTFRGVAQLVARDVWERVTASWADRRKLAKSPFFSHFLAFPPPCVSAKNFWPQIWPLTRPQFNNYRGVAQLIARRIWDAEAASLSLATPTNF